MSTAENCQHANLSPGAIKVYLAGPITGHVAARDSWRRTVADELRDKATVTDPSAHPVIRERLSSLSAESRDVQSEREEGLEILNRDREAVRNADVILANVSDTVSVSIGTVGELFWADAYGKDILLVRRAENSVYDHAMLNALASKIFFSLESAIDYIKDNY